MNFILKQWNEIPRKNIEKFYLSNVFPLYRNTKLGNDIMKRYMFSIACETEGKNSSISLVAMNKDIPKALGQIYDVDYLTKYWGIKCGGMASVISDQKNQDSSHEAMILLISELLEEGRKNGFEFISTSVAGEDIGAVRALEGCGFRYAEGFVNMVGRTNPFREEFGVPNLSIRDANESDYDAIAEAYSNVSFPSRFTSEPRFDTEKAFQLYVNRFVEVHKSRLGKVFVAELEGQFAGALIAIIDEKMEKTIGVKTNILSGMGIIIHPRAARKGISMALIEHRQEYYLLKGVNFVSFGANFNNWKMINGLFKIGLNYGSLDMTFHRWI